MSIPDDLLLSRADAAAALAISTDTLHRLIKTGELSVVRIGRSVLVPHDEVVALIERRRGRRPRRVRPTCSRCQRRIVGPRLVEGGLLVCAACAYADERRAAAQDANQHTHGVGERMS